MASAEILTPVPAMIGNVITQAVRDCAKSLGLEAEVWIRDLPLWSLSKREGEILRKLQIGVFRLEASDELRIVPQVLRLDKEAHSLVAAEQLDVKTIIGIDIWRLGNADELTTRLKQAWADLEKLQTPGTRVVSIPASPHFRW